MTGRLAGRIALVGGAGSVGPGWGNGRAVAAIFAAEGALVIAADRDPAALEGTCAAAAEAGVEIETATVDVTDAASVARLVDQTRARHGTIDILVNNVGGSHPGGVVDLDLDQWHAQLELNLTSVFLMCKHVVPVMRGGTGKAVVNIASTSGLRWTGSAQAGYAAAKAGVIQLSKVMAVQHAADGIRVNCVVPGQLHTPMVEARLAGQRSGGDVETLLATRQRRIPLGFMGDGRDTAYAALFLASEEARFVTGSEIVVDGGMTARCD